MFECAECPLVTRDLEGKLVIGRQFYVFPVQHDAMTWMEKHRPKPNRFPTIDAADDWLHRALLDNPYVEFKKLPKGSN